ncbi:hypothetical protein [Cyclobacterium jeungdonense]|uniref:Lipoprotein n=1 Tax=Cyclobacterium jeungdonense TaxID=708087 RepID=A0ABT8C8Q7_9BACT|nr:hypothetical protein [Cyclobacterium jeungdonense]MDN3688066.1 hypothetical protein [Cyclobacterium jeungdonense]
MKTNYLIVNRACFCFLLILTMSCNSNKSSKDGQQMVFLTDLTVIEPSDSIKFDTSWFDSKYKVAVYMNKVGRSITTLDWQPAISNNKEVAFLFYISEKDSSKLIRQLRENNFSHPVIHDPNKEFYKANGIGEVSFISFLLKDDRKVEMGNPSFPNFQERLDALTNE